jgi:Sec-independent protein translocase protein TatA
LIKSIRIFKKPAGSVRFQFYKSETEKTEPNPNKKNQKTKNTQAKPEKTEPVGLN